MDNVGVNNAVGESSGVEGSRKRKAESIEPSFADGGDGGGGSGGSGEDDGGAGVAPDAVEQQRIAVPVPNEGGNDNDNDEGGVVVVDAAGQQGLVDASQARARLKAEWAQAPADPYSRQDVLQQFGVGSPTPPHHLVATEQAQRGAAPVAIPASPGILVPVSAAAAAATAAAVARATEQNGANGSPGDAQHQFQVHLPQQLMMAMDGAAAGGGEYRGDGSDGQDYVQGGSLKQEDDETDSQTPGKKYRKHTKTSFSIAEKAQVLRWIEQQEAAQPNQPLTRNAVADYMQKVFPGTDRVSKPFVTLMRKQADRILEMAEAEGPEAERLKTKRRSRSGDPAPLQPRTPSKQTRTHFTINQKIQVLDWIKQEESKEGTPQLTRNQIIDYMQRVFPDSDRVSKPFITLLRKQEDHLRQLAATNTPARNEMKRNRVSHVQRLDAVMVELMTELIQNNVPFTDDQLTAQAKRFQKILNIPIGSYFRFSRDWLRRVKKQNGFVGAGSRINGSVSVKDDSSMNDSSSIRNDGSMGGIYGMGHVGAALDNPDISSIADRISLRHGATQVDFHRATQAVIAGQGGPYAEPHHHHSINNNNNRTGDIALAASLSTAAAAAAAVAATDRGEGLAALAAGAELDDASTIYEGSEGAGGVDAVAAAASAAGEVATAASAAHSNNNEAPPATAPSAMYSNNNNNNSSTSRPISNLSEACDAATDLHRFLVSNSSQEAYADVEPYMNIVARSLQKILVANAVDGRRPQQASTTGGGGADTMDVMHV